MRVGIVSRNRRLRRAGGYRAGALVASTLLVATMPNELVGAERRIGEPDLALKRAWSQTEGLSASHELIESQYELRQALDRVFVYWSPQRATRRAWIPEDAVFEVGAKRKGRGRCETHWASVRGGGFVCLDDTKKVAAKGPRLPAARSGPVPFLYAARANDPAFSYAFEGIARADDGERRLVRPDGRELDASRYAVHNASRFRGRDLRIDPVPQGMLPAWAVIEDAPVFPIPSDSVPAEGFLRKHASIIVAQEPADDNGHWYRIPDGLGPGRPGFVDDREAIRHWSPAPAIDDLAPHEVWIDIDLQQQVLAVRRGEDLLYVTLVSTGIASRPTPTGLYRIRDKRAWSSMGSRPTSEDRYFVEKVPWTMYFRDYYAIHGAYWHDVFGHPRSHGCINLAPHDAAYVYRVVSPRTEPAFMWTYASDEAPGSTVRIRKGRWTGRDHRD